jgi:hypothetical protein
MFGQCLFNTLVNSPEIWTGSDQFALGYRIHNSMFGRQFLHLWTYVLKRGDGIKLRDFAAWLNSEADFRDPATGNLLDPADDGKFCNGFDAAFVGATADNGFPDMMGDRLLHEFLPLKPVNPDAELPGLHGVMFHEFIPAEEMGKLYDDMRCFRKQRFTYEDLHGIFVEIAKEGSGVKVVGPSPRFLSDQFPIDHPITLSVGDAELTGFAGEIPEDAKAPPPPVVPWNDFANAITEIARAEGWFAARLPPGRTPESCFTYAERLLTDLNGPLPCCFSFLSLLAEFARVNEGKEDDFEWVIRAVHRQLVNIQAFRARYD